MYAHKKSTSSVDEGQSTSMPQIQGEGPQAENPVNGLTALIMELKSLMEGITGKLDSIEVMVDTLQNNVNLIGGRLNEVEQRVGSVEDTIIQLVG